MQRREALFRPGEQVCQSCAGWSCVHDARPSAVVGGLGPPSLCPAGVLPLLDLIAATMGYDLPVVEGGTLTYSNLCAQTDAQSRPD